MIVWSGRGLLSVLVLIVTLFLCVFIFPKEQGDYAFAIAAFAAGAFSWYFGDKWNNQDPRIVVDEKSGQKFNLKSVHSLFWIKMQYWGIIFSIIGIIILVQNSLIVSLISTIIILGISVFIYTSKKSKSAMMAELKVETKGGKSQADTNFGINEQIESEEERLKRLLEKEDSSRFMPK